MASSGPNSPGTMADDAAVGTLTWSTINNAKVSDASYSSTTENDGTFVTHYLKATNFGFSIPAGTTIDGILVEFQKKANWDNFVLGDVIDNIVKIVQGGSVLGNNKAYASHWSTTESYITYGSSSDLWGLSLSDSDVNSSSFGVVMSTTIRSGTKTYIDGYVNHIRITVYYTVGGGSFISKKLAMLGVG